MTKNESFLKRIETHYASLSPNSRCIADYLQLHPFDVLQCSVVELAQLTKTSKATVSRFFRQLGYESHQHAKNELRSLRSQGQPVSLSASHHQFLDQDIELLQQTWRNISQQQIQNWVTLLAERKRVRIIGFRNSYPIALHFRQQLTQIRDNVSLCPQPGQTLAEEIACIDEHCLYVVIAFRRRPKLINSILNHLPGNQTLLLGDPSVQIYADNVESTLVCQLGQSLALDSYAAPMSVVSAVCNGVLGACEKDGARRIDAITSLYDDFNELE